MGKQDHAQATYCSTYTRDDTWIDWGRSARELHNFVRAWDPDMLGVITHSGSAPSRRASSRFIVAGGVPVLTVNTR